MDSDLKNYREKELKSFVLGNILLILMETGIVDNIVQLMSSSDLWKAAAELFKSSIISSIIYIFVFCFDSILQGRLKNKVIWPIKGLPENTIFLDIDKNNKDERFSKQTARKVYEKLYTQIDSCKDKKKCEKIQNQYWYAIYQKYESQAQIYMAQRDFLLLRDMTIMMLWIGFMYVFLSWYIKRLLSCKLITVFIIEFILMWIGARVKGNRFAYNVIAKDLAKYYNEHNSKSLIS